jgi:4-amino-4-deoxy-L-arabinose transferase-like glycosyltransferase
MTFSIKPNTERLIVFGIIGLAIALRVIAAIVIPDQSQALPDVPDYRDSAEHFLRTGLMVDWFQMPLYPLLIAIGGPGVGQLGADITLSVVSVWLAYELSDQLFADQHARIFSAAAAACYPPLIFFAVVGLSESLFITLMLSAFLCWYRGWFTAAAIFAVLAILTRPIFDIFAPGLVLVFVLLVHRLPLTKALQHLAIYLTIYCALMAPWWLNNYKAYGSFVRLTLGAGTVLYAGNNPLNHSGGGNGGVDYDLSTFADITDPVKRDAALRDAAIDFIIHNPRRFLELAALKFQRTWQIWPVNKAFRNPANIIISTASFVPILLLAGVGLSVQRRRIRQLSPILLFALGYTGVLMTLVGTIRYRLPLEPFLIILAGAGASYLVQQGTSSRRETA